MTAAPKLSRRLKFCPLVQPWQTHLGDRQDLGQDEMLWLPEGDRRTREKLFESGSGRHDLLMGGEDQQPQQ